MDAFAGSGLIKRRAELARDNLPPQKGQSRVKSGIWAASARRRILYFTSQSACRMPRVGDSRASAAATVDPAREGMRNLLISKTTTRLESLNESCQAPWSLARTEDH